MADPTATEAPQDGQPSVNVDELALVRVVYRGNASLGEQTGEIKLAAGPNGESRTLTMNGSSQDALVTPAELHMLTGYYEIEVVEEQPELSEQDVVQQMPAPLSDAAAGQMPATMPNPNPDAELTPEQIKAAEEENERRAVEQAALPQDQASAGDQQAPESAPEPAPAEQAPQAPADQPQEPPQEGQQPAPPQTPEGDGAPPPPAIEQQVAPSELAHEENPTTTSTP